MSVKVHEAFSFDSFMDRLLFFDDFHGDQLQDEWALTVVATGAGAVIDAQTGGIYRLSATTNATADAAKIDWGGAVPIRSLLITKKVALEVRIKLSSITSINARMSLEFADATDWVQFFYSVGGVGGNWLIRTRAAAAVTSQDSGVAPDTDYHIYRIECHTHGSNHVHFYYDGTETPNSPISTNITALHLQPYFFIRTDENVAKSMDIDYVVVRQER